MSVGKISDKGRLGRLKDVSRQASSKVTVEICIKVAIIAQNGRTMVRTDRAKQSRVIAEIYGPWKHCAIFSTFVKNHFRNDTD